MTKKPKPPVHLSVILPEDLAALLHEAAYQNGKSKHQIVITALRETLSKGKP